MEQIEVVKNGNEVYFYQDGIRVWPIRWKGNHFEFLDGQIVLA